MCSDKADRSSAIVIEMPYPTCIWLNFLFFGQHNTYPRWLYKKTTLIASLDRANVSTWRQVFIKIGADLAFCYVHVSHGTEMKIPARNNSPRARYRFNQAVDAKRFEGVFLRKIVC